MTKRLVIGLVFAALLLPSAGYADFDIEECYGDCRGLPWRYNFGQVPHEGKLIPMMQGNYDDCMQECDRKFWVEFDRNTEGIKGKHKGK